MGDAATSQTSEVTSIVSYVKEIPVAATEYLSRNVARRTLGLASACPKLLLVLNSIN